MKRKLIALALTLTTIFACFSMTMISAETANDGAEAPALEAPVVAIGGHQRTVVADTTYGIRLVGLISNLNATEVGFDITLVKNDGTKATVNQPITEVYTSIGGQINGVETEITAASLGSNYIFTVVIPDVSTSEEYMGYSFSVYYKMGDDKTSSDTYKFVYKGSEHYVTYVVGDKVQPTFDKWYQGDTNEWYFHSSGTQVVADPVEVSRMWDGALDNLNAYGGIRWATNAYSQAKFDNPTVIGRLTLSSVYQPDCNVNAVIEASVNGEHWKNLYTITAEDQDLLNYDGWNINSLTIDIADHTQYNYIRVRGHNFSFLEIEVYEAVAVEGEEMLLDLSGCQVKSSTGTSDNWKYVATKSQDKGTSSDVNPANLWDKNPSGLYYGVYGATNLDAYVAVEFADETVITKITLNSQYESGYNDSSKIQASVTGDDDDWDTLYTVAYNKVGSFHCWGWKHVTFSFDVENITKYNHIRVSGKQFCLSEIQVYGITVAYSADFAAALNAA